MTAINHVTMTICSMPHPDDPSGVKPEQKIFQFLWNFLFDQVVGRLAGAIQRGLAWMADLAF